MFDRRQLLKLFASWPLLGGFASAGLASRAAAAKINPFIRRDYFTELGVRPVINGQGVVTVLTGSLLPPEVVEAMTYASHHFVGLVELNEKVGARIAELLRCEDAMVSAGAASAITLATAAAITGTDKAKVRLLPNLPEPRPEVIVPKGHLVYPQQLLACGVKLVEVDSPAAMERAFNPRTVLAFYLNKAYKRSVGREEFVRLCRKHRVPSFNDCASDVPPVENLFKYIEMGFDLVTFSGGKAICGPQSAGLLYGRKDLIEAARMNHSPNQSIGRGMKVNKEEILGMMVALELYLKKDHAKEWQEWEQGVDRIAAAVKNLPSVVTERYVPEVANQIPHLRITWDKAVVGLTPAEAAQRLREGFPSIEALGGRDSIGYNMYMLKPEEVGIVARRTREVLQRAV